MAFDCFVKIDGISGDSADENHKDWIEVMSFRHRITQSGAGSGGGLTRERCDHRDFTITKTIDKATPTLMLACCAGVHINNVKIELCRATGYKEKYMEYVLRDVVISEIAPEGDPKGRDQLPLEEISFNYGKIEWHYVETDHKTGRPKGNVVTHWDLVTNKGA